MVVSDVIVIQLALALRSQVAWTKRKIGALFGYKIGCLYPIIAILSFNHETPADGKTNHWDNPEYFA